MRAVLDMDKVKALLILGGGSALGLAHIGVISVIEEHYEIAGVVGTSVGAIVGAMTCLGFSSAELLRIASNDLAPLKIFSPLSLDSRISGIFNGKPVVKLFESWTSAGLIEDSLIPYLAVSFDLHTGRSILIDKGRFCDAMRASSSLPVIFTPYELGKHLCIDGGVEHPLPLAFANRIPADVVIAVNVLPKTEPKPLMADPYAEAGKPERFMRYDVLLRSLHHNQSFLALQAIARYEPDIVINAGKPNGKPFDFHKAEDFYRYGRQQAIKTLQEYGKPDFITLIRRRYKNLLARYGKD